MSKLRELTVNYFDFFSNQEIESLKLMFDKNIKLRDWEIDAEGIDDVIKANLNIFNSVESIKVKPLLIVEEDGRVFAELDIVINGTDSIKVVDIIEYNDNSKIINIRAFKG
tara:strand:- start:156 stop:488 length:333 start_codon:yes stop_codon:yes gene_type:complete